MITKQTIANARVVSHPQIVGSPVGDPLPSCTPYAAVSQSYIPYEETITYENDKVFNNCDHVKVVRSMPLGRPFRAFPDPADMTRYCTYAHEPLGAYASQKAALDNNGCTEHVLDDVPVSSYATKALQGMWPAVNDRMGESAINFALELPRRDAIRKTVRRVKELVSQPVSRRILLRTLLRAPFTASEKQFRQWLSNSNLAYQYGIKPLLSDIHGLVHANSDANESYRRLAKLANKRLRSHHRQYITELDDYLYDHGIQAGSAFSHNRRRIRTTTDAWFNATMEYTVTPPPLTPSLAKAWLLMDTLGLNFNPKTIWNATRYSFLIDWFLRVGDYLDQFKEELYDATVRIRSFGCSVQWKSRLETDDKIDSLDGSYSSGRYTRYQEHHEHYHRFRYVPSFYLDLSEFVGSGLDLNKVSLAASLYFGR